MQLQLSRFFLIKMGALLVSLGALTMAAILAGDEYAGPLATVGIGIICLCAGALLWSIRKYQTTELSDEGVKQATLRGSVFVPWSQVQEVRLYSGAYLLDSPLGQVIINPKAYDHSAAVTDFVTSRLQALMLQKGARVLPKKRIL